MKALNKIKLISLMLTILLIQLIFNRVPEAYVAKTPDLGQADSFRIRLGGIFIGISTLLVLIPRKPKFSFAHASIH